MSPSAQLKLEEQETELIELNGNTEKLLRAYAELNEMQQVLEKAAGFFDQKAKFGDVTMESYDRPFGVETDSPLLEAGVGAKHSARHIDKDVRSIHVTSMHASPAHLHLCMLILAVQIRTPLRTQLSLTSAPKLRTGCCGQDGQDRVHRGHNPAGQAQRL